jgi:hypothetical protein
MRRPTTALLIIAVIVVSVALAIRSNDDAPTDAGSTTVPNPTVDPATTTTTSTLPPTTAAPLLPPGIPPDLPPGVAVCELYGDIAVTGVVASTELVEASGLAMSRTTEGVLWAHNDSRGDPVLHAFTPAGEDLGDVEIPGAFAFDWEDMGAGPGADGTGSFLYVGDLGDNFGIRGGIVNVWQVPDVDPSKVDGVFPSAMSITYQLADGPFDAEALFVDPIEPAMYIVTKSRTEAFVFKGPLTPSDEPHPMSLVTTLFLDAEVTAADITIDGHLIAMRGYRTVWMWSREPGQSIADALETEPCTAPSPEERQGESIAFDREWGYFTVSEGATPPIHYVTLG